MSELELFRYESNEVRIISIRGEPWFVLSDLCKVLGLGTPARVRDRLDEGVSQTHTLQTSGGPQQMTIVSEAGMYEVVIRSDKPEAARFRRWITTDVLPSIRRTGGYGPAALPDRRALAQMVIEAEDAKALAEAKVAELEPAAAAWDSLADAEGDYSLREAAQILSRDPAIATGQNRLTKSLRELGVLDRRGEPYQTHIQHVRRRPTAYTHPHTGEPKLSSQLRITVSGVKYLHGKLGGGRPLRLDVATALEA